MPRQVPRRHVEQMKKVARPLKNIWREANTKKEFLRKIFLRLTAATTHEREDNEKNEVEVERQQTTFSQQEHQLTQLA